MNLTKLAIENQLFICELPKRKRCDANCKVHQFSIKQSTKNRIHLDAKVKFCPKISRGNPPQSTHPQFHNDKLFYTEAFVLGIDKKEVQTNQKQELADHIKMIKESNQKPCKVLFPKPNPKHTLCSVCKVNYGSQYYAHIMGEQHKKKIEKSVYNQYILELSNIFTHMHPDKDQEISSPFKFADHIMKRIKDEENSVSKSEQNQIERLSQKGKQQILQNDQIRQPEKKEQEKQQIKLPEIVEEVNKDKIFCENTIEKSQKDGTLQPELEKIIQNQIKIREKQVQNKIHSINEQKSSNSSKKSLKSKQKRVRKCKNVIKNQKIQEKNKLKKSSQRVKNNNKKVSQNQEVHHDQRVSITNDHFANIPEQSNKQQDPENRLTYQERLRIRLHQDFLIKQEKRLQQIQSKLAQISLKNESLLDQTQWDQLKLQQNEWEEDSPEQKKFQVHKQQIKVPQYIQISSSSEQEKYSSSQKQDESQLKVPIKQQVQNVKSQQKQQENIYIHSQEIDKKLAESTCAHSSPKHSSNHSSEDMIFRQGNNHLNQGQKGIKRDFSQAIQVKDSEEEDYSCKRMPDMQLQAETFYKKKFTETRQIVNIPLPAAFVSQPILSSQKDITNRLKQKLQLFYKKKELLNAG